MNVLAKAGLVFAGIVFAVIAANKLGVQTATVLPGYTGGKPNEAGPAWSYEANADPMSGSVVRQARIASPYALELHSPYQGEQHAIVVLRQDKRLGNAVVFKIAKGQILCGIRACSVPVRFDDEQPIDWPAARSADGDPTALFLGNYHHFVAKLNHAKRLRIEPALFQNGSPLVEFPVAGFDRAQYEGNR